MKDATHTAADAGGVVGPDVVAACALTAVPGMGASSLARLTVAFGSLADALVAGPLKILKVAAEINLKLRQDAVDYLNRKPDLEQLGTWAVETAKNAGARVVVIGDPWYPALLRQIDNPPPLLYVRGGLTDVRRIAIVGARETDDYGLELARELAEGLARAGVQVVSGGARGVDAAAHAGALWGTGTTCAVLGCGIDIVYPPENAALFDRLAGGGGAVVSEFPPNTPASRANFPRRNRTIAGLSTATVVVRARMDSGALLTANHAVKQGRALFAVPGQHGDELSEGPNSLLTAGVAQAVTGAEDLLKALGWPPPPPPVPAQGTRRKAYVPPAPPRPGASPLNTPMKVEKVAPRPVRPAPAVEAPPAPAPAEVSVEVVSARQATGDLSEEVLDEDSQRMLKSLDLRTPLHLDELAARAQVNASTALRKLLELEVKGLCLQRPGKYFLRR